MRILITGADGQLGHELQTALTAHALTLGVLPEFDLLGQNVESFVRRANPEMIIHAAAYTDVDGAEREPEVAMAVNGEGTERVARAAAQCGARLIYLSTDYVFDGKTEHPYMETDEPHPINVYGRSKLEGERRALACCENTLVVRTSWLYGCNGKNFVTTIMRLAGEGSELRVVADQRGCPTFAGDLATAFSKILGFDLRGIVHAVGSGECSWNELASAIVSFMGLSVPVRPITTEEAGRAAARPSYSVLANRVLAERNITLPHWNDSLRRFITEFQYGRVEAPAGRSPNHRPRPRLHEGGK